MSARELQQLEARCGLALRLHDHGQTWWLVGVTPQGHEVRLASFRSAAFMEAFRRITQHRLDHA